MDGIPVKISEKYKPPRKFILPGCIVNKINSDIKIEPYSFELERSVLENLAHLKEAKRKHHERKQFKRDDWLSKTNKKIPSEGESYPLDISDQVTTESTMLTPIPITSNYVQEPIRKVGQINLSDFENDTSSPFDNVELKTINEMEELAHVLGGTSIKDSSFHALKNHTSSNTHLPNGCANHQWGTSCGTSAYNYPGLYRATNNSGMTTGGAAITLPSPPISSNPYNYIHTASNTLYSNTVYSTAAGHGMTQSYSMSQNADSTFMHNAYLAHPSQSPLINQLPSNTPATHTYGSSPSNTVDKSYKPLPSYIPPSKSTANVHPPHTSSSLTNDPSANFVTAPVSHTPKKDDDYDDGVFKILNEIKMQMLLRKNKIQPRLSVPSPISSEIIRSTKPTTSRQNDSVQYNPLSQLSLQSQEFAKNMAEMGFPLSRVARATQKFGADEAKVIEFLLQIQSLEEQCYPEEQIEKALILYNFKEDEAANYLENLNQLMKLGFKEEDVELALSKSSNNRDKALDILIS